MPQATSDQQLSMILNNVSNRLKELEMTVRVLQEHVGPHPSEGGSCSIEEPCEE